MTRSLEALADALTTISGFRDPESPSYQNRNPLGLLAFKDTQPCDAHGQRIFKSFMDGYQAGLFDLLIKCTGRSSSKLKATSTLTDLVLTYHQPETAAKYVARFLRRALSDERITEKTELAYFVED